MDERPIALLFTSRDLVATALQDSPMLVCMRYCPDVYARAKKVPGRGEHHHTVPGEYPTSREGVVQ